MQKYILVLYLIFHTLLWSLPCGPLPRAATNLVCSLARLLKIPLAFGSIFLQAMVLYSHHSLEQKYCMTPHWPSKITFLLCVYELPLWSPLFVIQLRLVSARCMSSLLSEWMPVRFSHLLTFSFTAPLPGNVLPPFSQMSNVGRVTQPGAAFSLQFFHFLNSFRTLVTSDLTHFPSWNSLM